MIRSNGGAGVGGSGSTTFANLNDVDLVGLVDKDLLTYHAGSGTWVRTATPQVAGIGIGAAAVSGKVNWTDMQLYERAPVGVYANPQLVLADPDAGASVFVFHPYGSWTLSFEPGAIFSSSTGGFSLRNEVSEGTVQITDIDQVNIFSFFAGDPPSLDMPVAASLRWNASSSTSIAEDGDNPGELLISAPSVTFLDTGIIFSDFAIHPGFGGDGSVGTALLPFGSGYFATSVVTPLVTVDDTALTISTTTSGDLAIDSAADVSIVGRDTTDVAIALSAIGSGTSSSINMYGTGEILIATDSAVGQLSLGMDQSSLDQTGSNLLIRTITSGDIKLNTAGKLNIIGLPTSAAGLATGDVWRNSNVLTIVP